MADRLSLSQVIADVEQLSTMSLDELAENINEGYNNASLTARKLAIDISRIGAMLLVAQMKCREQEIVWCNRSGDCPNISRATAHRYISVYKKLEEQISGVSLMRHGDIIEEEKDEIALQSLPVTNAYVALGILPSPPKANETTATKVSAQERIKAMQIKIEKLNNKIAELEGMLTEEQKAKIKLVAQQTQTTFEDIVREAINNYLEQLKSDT